jgi:hypothetical protein
VKKILIALLIVAAVGAVIAYDQQTKHPFVSSDKPPSVLSQVQLVGFAPGFDYANAKVWADFLIVNNSQFTLNEVVLHCEYQDSFGAKVYENDVHLIGAIRPHTPEVHTHSQMAAITKDMRTANCSLADGLRFS